MKLCREFDNRYKMADLKPKGRDEGFSAQDREKGAEWLRGMIAKFGPVVKANCHQIVNYKGTYLFIFISIIQRCS